MSDKDAIEVLKERWEITEWKNGEVFRTKYVDCEWRSFSAPDREGNYLYVPMSNNYSGQTIRRKKK